MGSNPLRLPWSRWDLHVVDCDGHGVAFNVGAKRADVIVESVNKMHSAVSNPPSPASI